MRRGHVLMFRCAREDHYDVKIQTKQVPMKFSSSQRIATKKWKLDFFRCDC